MTRARHIALLVACIALGAITSVALRDRGATQHVQRAAIATRFTPDEKTVERCARTDVACLRQAFGNIAFTQGPRIAMQRLQQIHDSGSNPTVALVCHTLAHEIGRAAFARTPGAPGKALSEGNPMCGGGFEHGVLESVFSGVPLDHFADKARTLCSTLADFPSREACRHGVGHGAMLLANYDVRKAIAICDDLHVTDARDFCGTGMFMENLSSLPGKVGPWLRSDNLAYPCNVVPQAHKWACYRQVASRGSRAGIAWPTIAATCGSVESAYVATCVGGMGMLVSSIDHNTPAEIVRVCDLAPAWEQDCLYNAASELLNIYGPTSRRLQVCALAGNTGRFRAADDPRVLESRAFGRSIMCDRPLHSDVFLRMRIGNRLLPEPPPSQR